MHTHPSTALKLLKWAWPDLVEHQGCIFLQDGLACSGGFEKIEDRTGREAFVNHVHVLDVLGRDVETIKAARAIPNDEVWQIAMIVAQMWASRLRGAFPDSSFRVYATRDDEPIVRFHRCYSGESVWLDAANYGKDRVFLLEVPGSKMANNE